jgi:hypothetical protein
VRQREKVRHEQNRIWNALDEQDKDDRWKVLPNWVRHKTVEELWQRGERVIGDRKPSLAEALKEAERQLRADTSDKDDST